MGGVISRLFKKKREKTTYEKLEAIELKIKEIEEFSDLYQLKQKRFVGNVLIYGLGTSIIAFLVFYFAFLPKTLEKKIVYSIPIISLPAFIFLLKNLVAWYFQRKVNSNSEQLSELRAEKRELLDHVKTKETYKDAVEILQRFGNDRSTISSTPIRQSSSSPTDVSKTTMVNTSTNMTPSLAALKTPAGRQLINVNRNISTLQQRMNAAQSTPGVMDPNRSIAVPSSVAVVRGMKRTPFPIVDSSQKSVIDKMVDYLIGDGPANRFAMICQQCFKHNGMALQEEYEYAAFRCAFCNFFNPAKKLRPIAPRLQTETHVPSFNIQRPSTSSDSSSCSDTDNEISKKKLKDVTEIAAALEEKHEEEETLKEQNMEEIESESVGDEIEFIEKPERHDIEKKLE
ncbi:hypothetical protein PVAND_012236 [Polypedilum vanderplanki]|uniref:Endoplasmic reticulum junction formation protein lunapark n=1 Tax=Polypedilum vanderplanki TaxID=319348 RepID=A0A9J6CMS7_POLVA|nr:hypothetical protein PVAND_012236 [Polypedilum vanderplanki]